MKTLPHLLLLLILLPQIKGFRAIKVKTNRKAGEWLFIKEHTRGSKSGCGQYQTQADPEAGLAETPEALLHEAVKEGIDHDALQGRLPEALLKEAQAKKKYQTLHGKNYVNKLTFAFSMVIPVQFY